MSFKNLLWIGSWTMIAIAAYIFISIYCPRRKKWIIYLLSKREGE